MGFPGYFLIVADFIKWAKGSARHPRRAGPRVGRGLARGLRAHDHRPGPAALCLLFERFLNPDRVSMPDFDIDFCMDRREEVIRYVQERYGRDKVGQIITFGALLSKAAVRDVGRVLQMPYGQCDQLSKMIPVEGVKPVSIAKALADEPRLREAAPSPSRTAARVGRPRRLLDYAEKLEGLLRNASTHAAGVVIGDRPLDKAGAALQGPALGHARDPVQHEMGREGGAGEVRLPRPEDPDPGAERGRPDPRPGPRHPCRRRRARPSTSRRRGTENDIAA